MDNARDLYLDLMMRSLTDWLYDARPIPDGQSLSSTDRLRQFRFADFPFGLRCLVRFRTQGHRCVRQYFQNKILEIFLSPVGFYTRDRGLRPWGVGALTKSAKRGIMYI